MPIERITKAHEVKEAQHLILDNRESLSLSGAQEVISFSDTAIELNTNLGVLLIRGEGLKIVSVSTESKTAEVSGKINMLEYKKPRSSKSVLKNIFK